MENKQTNRNVSVLIINFHSTKNAGDLSLLLTTRELLNNVFVNPVVSVSANWPDEPFYHDNGFDVVPSLRSIVQAGEKSTPMKQICRFIWIMIKLFLSRNHKFIDEPGLSNIPDWVALRMSYLKADLVVVAPGNQLYSTGRFGWPYPLTIMAIQLANWYNKPLIILPQSIGPLRRNWERKLLYKTYAPAKYIYLRDATSLKLANDIHLDQKKVAFGWDLAFGLIPASQSDAHKVLKKYKISPNKPKIGVTIISAMGKALNQGDVKNYYLIMTKVLGEFARSQDIQIVLFTQVSGPSGVEDDRTPTKQFYEDLVNRGMDVVYINQDLPPELLKACYGQMDMFVASRLHSGIFAFGMGVPTLFIGYLTKTIGMLNSLGIPDLGVNIASLNEETLQLKLSSLWVHRQELRSWIQTKMIEIDRELDKQVKHLAGLLKENI